MLYLDKVKVNRELFGKKVAEISARLKVQPDWLMLVMYSESKLNHKAVNPKGGATGLIQFMPRTAVGLGTTTAQLKAMSNIQQLDYVEKYFKPYAGKMNSYFDMYLVTFFPVAVGKPDDFVLQTKTLRPEKIAEQNPAINKWPKDNQITKREFRKYVESTIPKNVLDTLQENTGPLGILLVLVVVGIVYVSMS